MLPSFCKTTVTIERAPYVESRGTQIRDWSNPESFTVSGCNLQPSSSDTSWTDTSQAVTIRARLWMPPATDVQADDRITVNGVQYAIAGAPQTWESPTGAVDHIEVALIDWIL